MQTKQSICWSGMTDTELAKSGSNEEGLSLNLLLLNLKGY